MKAGMQGGMRGKLNEGMKEGKNQRTQKGREESYEERWKEGWKEGKQSKNEWKKKSPAVYIWLQSILWSSLLHFAQTQEGDTLAKFHLLSCDRLFYMVTRPLMASARPEPIVTREEEVRFLR